MSYIDIPDDTILDELEKQPICKCDKCGWTAQCAVNLVCFKCIGTNSYPYGKMKKLQMGD